MNKLILSLFIITSSMLILHAEENNSSKAKQHTEHNSTKAKRAEAQIKEQIKREEKYAKEQKFYQGKNFDLSELEVDPKSLDDIPDLEPDYSFSMDDVYD